MARGAFTSLRLPLRRFVFLHIASSSYMLISSRSFLVFRYCWNVYLCSVFLQYWDPHRVVVTRVRLLYLWTSLPVVLRRD